VEKGDNRQTVRRSAVTDAVKKEKQKNQEICLP
jgi:hypothetical protein